MKQCKGCLAVKDNWDPEHSSQCTLHKLAVTKKIKPIHLSTCPCQECLVKMMCVISCDDHKEWAADTSYRHKKGIYD